MLFDAHGISKGNQLEQLLKLLETGIDPSKPFYTAPFEVTAEMRSAGSVFGTSGGTAYKDGIAVVTSGFKQSIKKDGIKHVFLNDVYADMKKPLQELFPQYQVHLLSEQNAVLEKEAQAKS